MSELDVWLLAYGAALIAYCLYCGVVQGRASRTIDDWFLAGRSTPAWQFVLAATALSVTGWFALGHPAMIRQAGFAYAEVALGAVAVPLAGIVFLKRQWLLARRHGHTTPVALYGDYYGGELIRLAVLLIAIVFAIPFVGMQLAACGELIAALTDGKVDRHGAMWIVGFSIFVYVYLGGLRAATAAATLQCMLMLAGMVGLGCVAYVHVGGFGEFNAALAALGADPVGAELFRIPGVVQFTAGLGVEAPLGGTWTAATVLGCALALMGIQAAPSFTMLGMSSRDTRGYAPQQVWATGAIVGVVLLMFSLAQGFGARLGEGGASAAAGIDVTAAPLRAIGVTQPWLAALLAVCLLAAIQAAAALYLWTTSAMLSRDFYRRYIHRRASPRAERVFARSALAVMFALALTLATYTPQALAQLGALALSFAAQLWPLLAGLCWLPWVSRQGVLLGLGAGLIAVVLTEPAGASLLRWLGIELPWGRWPWTIHSAGWGLFCNLLICWLVSLATRRGNERARRDAEHRFLREQDALTPRKHAMRPAVWALLLAWFFFAVGPGAVIGNELFGAPGGGLAGWKLGIPSLWAWQILWWALGVFVIWWLAYKMELATPPRDPAARAAR